MNVQELESELEAVRGVRCADNWQTGGGVMVLAVHLEDGRLVTFGPEDSSSPAEYECAAVCADVDTWNDPGAWDDGRVAVTYRYGSGEPVLPFDAAEVLAFVRREIG